MYDIFSSLLIAFAFIGCNQKTFTISTDEYKIEILNFDNQNFVHSKSALGTDLDIYKSEFDSIIILIDYTPSRNNIREYYKEERFIDAFDNLKHQEINFIITLNTKFSPDKLISEDLVFREWSRTGLPDYQKFYEFIHSEITDTQSLYVTIRKNYSKFDLMEIMEWVNQHPIKIYYLN